MSRRRSEPRVVEHWYALAAFLVALAVALALQGYARHDVGRASTRSTSEETVAPGLATAGPILDLSAAKPRSAPVPVKQVALTFDDGPNPTWTPKILAVLERYHVHATFFVIGSHVTSWPGIVRRAVADGNEIGNHTFTHVDLAQVPEWRGKLELRLTEVALAAAIHQRTLLLRPPYSSEPDAVGPTTLHAWQRDTAGHYLVVLANRDAEDWRPHITVDQILRSATPIGDAGAVILMHDGGGNRERTVAALERLIPSLQARGYRFVTASQLAHVSQAHVMPAVSASEHLRSEALPVSLQLSEYATTAFTLLALLVAILALLRAAVLFLFARRHVRSVLPADPSFAPRVSVVVPAYNEQQGIAAAVRSLATSIYPALEVIVVDDGSTDGTAAVVSALIADEGLANVHIVQQANRGKADALNAGIARASGEIIVTVDGDTMFAPDTVSQLVQPFADERVGAVSGNTKVANRGGLLGRWQHIEYVMGFNLDRRMYDVLGCMPTVPGAIGAFRTSALQAVGGFSSDTLAEDTEITMALHRAGWHVRYEPRALAWTEAPSGLRDLWRQRYRWSYGTMQSVWKHKRSAIERGDGGRLGRIGLPYLVLFQILLPLLGPAVDLFSIYAFLFLNLRLLAVYWIAFTLLQVIVAAYALRIDGESLRPLWAVPIQQFLYRQLMYLVVLQSGATALAGVRVSWQKLRRVGVTVTAPAA